MFRKKKSATKDSDAASKPRRIPGEPGNPLARRFEAGDNSPTVRLDGSEGVKTEKMTGADEAATRIIAESELLGDRSPADRLDDPPVGFLVIIDGPGKGNVLTFGYGMNSIGRAESERVVIDFGDDRLSREKHAMVTFDGESRTFYVQHGGGPNLTYLGDDPVLTPEELSPGDRIRLGDTVLLFLPLCGDDFDWL